MTIPLEQAQKDLEKLVERVLAGEDLVLTRNGLPVARVIREGPLAGKKPDRIPGSARGLIRAISPDFDAPLDEMREYMG